MPRPVYSRQVNDLPPCRLFKPAGVPVMGLEEVVLKIDEYEALRLADFEGMYQEQAAEKMGVSRQTFGRILVEARKKVAEFIVHGKALRIEGGEFFTPSQLVFFCASCRKRWTVEKEAKMPALCPECESEDIQKAEFMGKGGGRGRGKRCGRGKGRGKQ